MSSCATANPVESQQLEAGASKCIQSFTSSDTSNTAVSFNPSEFSQSTPPVSNTGAQITNCPPSENRLLIDWFSATVKTTDPLEACQIFGLPSGLFEHSPSGGMGYKAAYRYGNITIYHDGTEAMGCHVVMSGKGCRQYEAQCGDNIDPWPFLIENIKLHNGKIARIDVAHDTVDGSLQIGTIQEAIYEKKVRSRFKNAREINSFTLSRGSESDKPTGSTVYFGSGNSRIQFRIYDKAREQGLDCPWVRFELQMRDERAEAFCRELLTREDVGNLTSEVINHYLSFIEIDDSNISRCSLSSWWSAWLLSSKKQKLTLEKLVKTVPQVVEHLKKQYAASVAMVRKYFGPIRFKQFVEDLIEEGQSKMTLKHRQILAVSGAYRL